MPREITSWLPKFDASKNFISVSGWDAIIKQIYLVLVTRKNTRQWQPDFGCNLLDYLFEIGDQKENIKTEIKNSMHWVPEVEVLEVDVQEEKIPGRTGKRIYINMRIKYLEKTKKLKLLIPESIDLLRGSIYDIKIVEVN